jgi:TonB-dependent starch-binding outer membrane protein SusC
MNLKRLLTLILGFVMLSIAATAQDKTVTGKVTDSKGQPVAGATVMIKGTKTGTATTNDGSFSIKAPTGATLVISSIGFTSQEVSAASASSISLVSSAGDALNEIVVVGYGSSKKKDLTGSVVSISSKDFVKGAITTPEQLIAGKVAGVQVTPNGGAPGSGSVIRVRGGSSLNASNDPLIIVDGMPLDNGGISGSANALALINPDDIETFDILKDASAAAIYGSRASNGVLIITTKRGKTGKPTINFSTMVSVYTKSGKVDVLSSQQFRDYVNANGNAAQKALLGTANTDWQDEIYKTAIASDNNLSIRGAYKKVPYRVSLGYLNQDGILRGGNLQRNSASITVNPKFFNDHLKIDLNLKGAINKSIFANESAIYGAISFDPTQPVYSGNNRFGGFWEWRSPSTSTGLVSLSPNNPLGLLKQRDDRSNVQRSIGNVKLDYKLHFFPDLRAVLNLGYDKAKGTGTILVNDSAASDYKRFSGKGGVNNEYRQEKSNELMEFYFNYVKEVKSIKSRFDVVAGYSYQDFKATTYNFNDLTFDKTIVSKPNFPLDIQQNRLVSFYSRLNYAFKGKYLLTASVRRDGSSRFTPDNRWGLFYSTAAAWRMKDESFLKNISAINEMKLRVGYGTTGQQDGIGNYGFNSFYNLSSGQSMYQFGNTYYNLYAPSGYDANRKWEQTGMFNVALDFGLFKNRINGTIEYYNRETKDLLNDISQPAGANFSNRVTTNVGTMKNEGVEITLNTGIIRKRDMSLDLGFNVTYNKNRITKLTLSEDPNYAGNTYGGIYGGTGQTILINAVGGPRGAFYVYKQVYDKAGKPVDGLFEDLNRDGIINEKDKYAYKQVDPTIFAGFNGTFTYKKFDMGFVMRGSFDNYVFNNVNSATGVRNNILNPLGFLGNGSTDVLKSGFSGGGDKYSNSDYYVQNASFLRMDNINFGYSVGRVFNNKAGLRVIGNIQNAFVITKYNGLDPEINGGIDTRLYPRPRVFVLGANLTF